MQFLYTYTTLININIITNHLIFLFLGGGRKFIHLNKNARILHNRTQRSTNENTPKSNIEENYWRSRYKI